MPAEATLHDERAIDAAAPGLASLQPTHCKLLAAYYTSDDITAWIAQNTIIPALFDAAQKRCPSPFAPDGEVWRLLRERPDRYVHQAVRKGADLPLPSEIAAGVPNVARRGSWNRPAEAAFALPTETWREHVARREHCHQLRAKLRAGEVHSVNDVVTHNLDIGRFAQDVLDRCTRPDLLWAFWKALESVSILDPTCGTGQFLIAALGVLQPLYAACLERMEAVVTDRGTVGARVDADGFDFCQVLDAAEHANRSYFVCKSIIGKNLYGVDIDSDAAAVCKQRLLGALGAALPGIDCNIRTGNALVGFAWADEVPAVCRGRLEARGQVGAAASSPGQLGGKTRANEDGCSLTIDLLDSCLAGQYEVDARQPGALARWQRLHQPFHWFAEFPKIMSSGGFDVMIGNPPYVEYRLVRDRYRIMPDRFASESTGNVYAFCMERAAQLGKASARLGMIVPSSLLGLDELAPLRTLLLERFAKHWLSSYAIRPAKLFAGVDQRLCIHLAGPATDGSPAIHTTGYQHWNAQERKTLFAGLTYHPSFVYEPLGRIVQLGSVQAYRIMQRLVAQGEATIASWCVARGCGFRLYYHRSPRYWIRATDFAPHFRSGSRRRSVHHVRELCFASPRAGKAAGAILNSSLFFFWFAALCNGRNLAAVDVQQFPVGRPGGNFWTRIASLFDELMQDYQAHSLIRVRQDCELQEFRPGRSKPILDRIDHLLADHYGFDAQERDYLVNFEIKYRLAPRQREP